MTKNPSQRKKPNQLNDKLIEEAKQEVKYVFTNPLKTTKLKPDDLVFVLAQKDPGAAADTWDDYKEFKEQNGINSNFQTKNEKGRQIDEIREQTNNIQEDGYEFQPEENTMSNNIRTMGKKREFEDIVSNLMTKIGTLKT